MNESDRETRRFPAKKVDRAHFAPIQRWHLYQIAHVRGAGTYGCYTYKHLIGRLGIAERLRAIASELPTKAARRENDPHLYEVASSSARFRRRLGRSAGANAANFDVLARPHDRQQ
jgi:hypothetical protein